MELGRAAKAAQVTATLHGELLSFIYSSGHQTVGFYRTISGGGGRNIVIEVGEAVPLGPCGPGWGEE